MTREDLVERLEKAGYECVESRRAWLFHPVAGVPVEPTAQDCDWLVERSDS